MAFLTKPAEILDSPANKFEIDLGGVNIKGSTLIDAIKENLGAIIEDAFDEEGEEAYAREWLAERKLEDWRYQHPCHPDLFHSGTSPMIEESPPEFEVSDEEVWDFISDSKQTSFWDAERDLKHAKDNSGALEAIWRDWSQVKVIAAESECGEMIDAEEGIMVCDECDRVICLDCRENPHECPHCEETLSVEDRLMEVNQ
jgi:hypothetical protein